MTKLFLSLVLLSACFAGIQGLKCYSCNYTNILPDYMKFCGEPFNDKSSEAALAVVSCEDGVCIKSKGRIIYDGGYVEGLSRGCKRGINVTAEECANACGSVSGLSGCEHCCDTNLCNGASSVTFNLLMASTMLVLTLIALAFKD